MRGVNSHEKTTLESPFSACMNRYVVAEIEPESRNEKYPQQK